MRCRLASNLPAKGLRFGWYIPEVVLKLPSYLEAFTTLQISAPVWRDLTLTGVKGMHIHSTG